VLGDAGWEGVQPSKKLYNFLAVMTIRVGKVAPLSTWPWLLEVSSLDKNIANAVATNQSCRTGRSREDLE
jgi:hypothetical protein